MAFKSHFLCRNPLCIVQSLACIGDLTLEEAAAYCGIGINKLREITNESTCNFVLWVGSKRLIKRKRLDTYLEEAYSI